MVANVSADVADLPQALDTLRFASAVKEIKTDARPRRAPRAAAAAAT